MWHQSELNGNREYHVRSDERELRVSDFINDHDPRLSFHVGMSDLPLEKLNLEGSALATFPSVFIRCRELVEIHCSSVGLYSLPRMFGASDHGLTKLTTLNLSKNNLKELPKSIGDLLNLKELDVSDNWLTTLPDEIWNLVNLETLYVEDNVLIDLPEKWIGSMTKLRLLDCSNNKLSDSWNVPEGLLLLSGLKRLCLHGNIVLPKLLICNGPSCNEHWEVDTDSGKIHREWTQGRIEFTPNKFYVISNMLQPPLTSLKLSQCNLQFVPKRIMELESLMKLDLSNSSFCKLPDDIHKLRNLRTLDISNNDRMKYVPDGLNKCTKLKKVIVKDCLYCEDLLKSLDTVFKDKLVRWKDRPPLIPKLIIKFFVCTALLILSIFTMRVNVCVNNECDKMAENRTSMALAYLNTTCVDDADVAHIPFLYGIKRFAVVVSLTLLLPHAVDVGAMMDHVLQVRANDKFHKILELQDKLADRIDFPTILRHNWWGFWSSFSNLFCCFWCTRPWDLEQHLQDEEKNMKKTDKRENRCSFFPWWKRPWMERDKWAPLSLDVFWCSPVASLRRIFHKSDDPVSWTWKDLFVILVEWLDTIQTLALFPLSASVILSSGSVNDVFVNVVAVSVYARLDDEAVELFTKPQASLVERWCLYTGSGDDLKRSGVIEIKGSPADEEDPYISSTSYVVTWPNCKTDMGDISVAADTLRSVPTYDTERNGNDA
jgi:Leucine rich repeat